MKPRIFLSHSKKDKLFIEKLANDLRNASLDVWYDEWEIPPGESIRKKIFEDGIPNCDAFFVYLTENSIDSYWVRKELDAMTVLEAENRNSQMALFVSKDDLRSKISSDLRALNVPEFNSDNYLIPFSKLISRTWHVFAKKIEREKQKDTELKILSLEKEKLELEKRISDLQNSNFIDFSKLESKLKLKTIQREGIRYNLLQIFDTIKLSLADGINEYQIRHKIEELFEIGTDFDPLIANSEQSLNIQEIIGELIVWGLIEIKKPTDQYSQLYYLSDTGLYFARKD